MRNRMASISYSVSQYDRLFHYIHTMGSVSECTGTQMTYEKQLDSIVIFVIDPHSTIFFILSIPLS